MMMKNFFTPLQKQVGRYALATLLAGGFVQNSFAIPIIDDFQDKWKELRREEKIKKLQKIPTSVNKISKKSKNFSNESRAKKWLKRRDFLTENKFDDDETLKDLNENAIAKIENELARTGSFDLGTIKHQPIGPAKKIEGAVPTLITRIVDRNGKESNPPFHTDTFKILAARSDLNIDRIKDVLGLITNPQNKNLNSSSTTSLTERGTKFFDTLWTAKEDSMKAILKENNPLSNKVFDFLLGDAAHQTSKILAITSSMPTSEHKLNRILQLLQKAKEDKEQTTLINKAELLSLRNELEAALLDPKTSKSLKTQLQLCLNKLYAHSLNLSKGVVEGLEIARTTNNETLREDRTRMVLGKLLTSDDIKKHDVNAEAVGDFIDFLSRQSKQNITPREVTFLLAAGELPKLQGWVLDGKRNFSDKSAEGSRLAQFYKNKKVSIQDYQKHREASEAFKMALLLSPGTAFSQGTKDNKDASILLKDFLMTLLANKERPLKNNQIFVLNKEFPTLLQNIESAFKTTKGDFRKIISFLARNEAIKKLLDPANNHLLSFIQKSIEAFDTETEVLKNELLDKVKETRKGPLNKKEKELAKIKLKLTGVEKQLAGFNSGNPSLSDELKDCENQYRKNNKKQDKVNLEVNYFTSLINEIGKNPSASTENSDCGKEKTRLCQKQVEQILKKKKIMATDSEANTSRQNDLMKQKLDLQKKVATLTEEISQLMKNLDNYNDHSLAADGDVSDEDRKTMQKLMDRDDTLAIGIASLPALEVFKDYSDVIVPVVEVAKEAAAPVKAPTSDDDGAISVQEAEELKQHLNSIAGENSSELPPEISDGGGESAENDGSSISSEASGQLASLNPPSDSNSNASSKSHSESASSTSVHSSASSHPDSE